MSYRDYLGLSVADQLRLGVRGYDQAANGQRQRRAQNYVNENLASGGGDPVPVGVHVLARNGGDVRAAISGQHDRELHDQITQQLPTPDQDGQAAQRELERAREELLREISMDSTRAPQTRPHLQVVHPEEGLGVDGGPSQRHLADVREALDDAAQINTTTGQEPGGDGDAAAAREASLRAAQTVAPAQRGTSARPTTRGSAGQRPPQVTAAMVAAHERRRTDYTEERVEVTAEQLRARDDRREYPSIDQRDPQHDQRLR